MQMIRNQRENKPPVCSRFKNSLFSAEFSLSPWETPITESHEANNNEQDFLGNAYPFFFHLWYRVIFENCSPGIYCFKAETRGKILTGIMKPNNFSHRFLKDFLLSVVPLQSDETLSNKNLHIRINVFNNLF